MRRESNTERYDPDTAQTQYISCSGSGGPIKNRAAGLDVNLKHDLERKTTLSLLLAVRYEKNELVSSQQSVDTSYTFPDLSKSSSHNISLTHDDKAYCVSLGAGVEKDFSPSVKVAAACRGYWDRDKLSRKRLENSSATSWIGDSLTQVVSSFYEGEVEETADSYELLFPVAAEVVLHKMVKARLGGGFSISRNETETGYSTSSRNFYSHGFGLSYDETIFLDIYVREEIDRVANWLAKVEYRF